MATKQTNMRFPEELLDRIDQFQREHATEFRNRTDATIALIRAGLKVYELDAGYPPEDLIAAMRAALTDLQSQRA